MDIQFPTFHRTPNSVDKNYYRSSRACGPITRITIYEFDSAKVEEANEQISNAYWRFHDVPGYSFQLIPCVKARDAAKKILELV